MRVLERCPEELPLQRPADPAIPLEGVGAAAGPDRHPRRGAVPAVPGAGREQPLGVFGGGAQAGAEGPRDPAATLRRGLDPAQRPDDGQAAQGVLPAVRRVAEAPRDGRRQARALGAGLHAGAQGGADDRRSGGRGERRSGARGRGDTVQGVGPKRCLM